MTSATGGLDAIATVDLGGVCRGRAVPEGAGGSVGWVPANLAVTPFATLADNPFGSLGDLRLCADPTTVIALPTRGAPVSLALGDLHNSDGTRWECCPRALLRQTLADLKARTGLTIRAAFEHEFVLSSDHPPEHPFSVQALLSGEPFGSQLVAALEQAGLCPETWLPEFGNHQWEVTVRPAEGLIAADRAILLREIVRALARMTGTAASFTPTPPDCGATSGAHIHFSLWTAEGEPATCGDGSGTLSSAAASFAAGVLEHASALTALTAPAVVSYDRLGPGHWSADRPRLAVQDREALLRIPGPTSMSDDRAAQVHLEYRAADSTANPWLALGALVRAGADGLARDLPAPGLTGPGATNLPASLDEALVALEEDSVMSSWLPADLLRTYLSMKRAEISVMSKVPADEVHARYAEAY
jgi:glutamine synthetase